MAGLVLIVVDGAKRELFGASLLARYLDDLDLQVRLCGSQAMWDYYARYVPDAVVVPHALLDLSDMAERSYVFVMPSESGNGQPDQIRNNHAGSPHNRVYPEAVDRFFCWGLRMKELLLESRAWREDQLVVTGSPSTDHWFLPRPGEKPSSTRIGLTTTFRAISNATPPGKMNYFAWLDFAERSGGDGTFYEPPEHAESWLFFEASFARAIASLLRKLALESGASVVVRPHPMEFTCRYDYFRELTGGLVAVDQRGTITEWLDDKTVLFTYMSASALDAVVRGVPVVSMKGLLDPDAIRKKPRHFRYAYEDMLWQISNVEEAAEYAQAAAKGQLRTCRDEKGVREFLAQHFAYPRTCPAAHQIAVEVKKVVESGDRRGKRAGWRSVRSGKYGIKDAVCRAVPLTAQALSLGRYLYGLLPGKQDLNWSYHPWRIGDRREAMRCAARVQSSVGPESGGWLGGS